MVPFYVPIPVPVPAPIDIYGKIGVNKRGAAIVWARERGLAKLANAPKPTR